MKLRLGMLAALLLCIAACSQATPTPVLDLKFEREMQQLNVEIARSTDEIRLNPESSKYYSWRAGAYRDQAEQLIYKRSYQEALRLYDLAIADISECIRIDGMDRIYFDELEELVTLKSVVGALQKERSLFKIPKFKIPKIIALNHLVKMSE